MSFLVAEVLNAELRRRQKHWKFSCNIGNAAAAKLFGLDELMAKTHNWVLRWASVAVANSTVQPWTNSRWSRCFRSSSSARFRSVSM